MVAIISPSFIILFHLIFLSRIIVESTQNFDRNQNDSKPTSIESVNGDIYDCVDVHKQPSLDHPDLLDHKIKMSPSHENSTSFQRINEDQENKNITHIHWDYKKMWKFGKGCPKGMVPIPKKKTTSSSNNLHVPKNINVAASPFFTSLSSFQGLDFVGLCSRPGKTFYGASAFINLQNPTNFPENEYSSALISLQSGGSEDNFIQVGWTVNPSLYKDYNTRLFTKWLGHKGQGCYNMDCPGFISVNNNIPLNLVFNPTSIKGGDQYDVDLAVKLDPTRGWWLLFGNVIKGIPIGYWPLELFSTIQENVDFVLFGGETLTSGYPIMSPPMGTGVFNNGLNNGTCYMRRVLVIDETKAVIDADDSFMNLVDNSRDCYHAGENSFHKDNDYLRYSFTFGGSGKIDPANR